MKNLLNHRKTLSLPYTFLFAFLSSVAITLLVIFLQPGGFFDSMQVIIRTPSLIVLNGFPVLLLVFLLYFITGNMFAGASAAALIAEILSYANLLKLEARNDPLVPADIALLREGMDAVGEYKLNLHVGLLILIAASVLAFVILAICFPTKRPHWLVRILSSAALIGLAALSMIYIYPNKDYYESLPGGKSNVPQVFNTYGFPYCFLHNVNLYPVTEPDNYNETEVESWIENTSERSTAAITPNIVYVMGEAFTDLSDDPVFSYQQEDNPTYPYHLIADSEQAISGHIVVSLFGAGTANTEFDVLTGMQTAMIADNTTSAFRVVHHNLDSIARFYGNNGYKTWFIHPGQSWFYNRCNVYPYLGISDLTFEEGFAESDYIGSYISDEAVGRNLVEKLESTDSPQLSYIVTIENHQAYTYGKYRNPPDGTLPVDIDLSEEAVENLSVYFTGVRHTSDMIFDLAEYLDALDEPTILIFFGDHRPNLGADYLSYKAIGSDIGQCETMEQTVNLYEVPYMIWANKALCQMPEYQDNLSKLELKDGNIISANYLSSVVYELTGNIGSDAYWDFLCNARRILPVIRRECCLLPDGTYTDILSEEQTALVDKMHWWEYYRIQNGMK
ncbi:MAG: hypothetical protein CW335_05330 [Clostridiales bacterium]|nr:hypothetical protein [Clostridiales bacterium]